MQSTPGQVLREEIAPEVLGKYAKYAGDLPDGGLKA